MLESFQCAGYLLNEGDSEGREMVPLILDFKQGNGSRRAGWMVAGGVIGFALLIGLLNNVASHRWDEIRAAMDMGAAQAVSGAGAAVFEAPGTTVTVGERGRDGRVPVTFETVSVEACFLAWATYAPVSGLVTFHDRETATVLAWDAVEANEQALESCRGFEQGKRAVYRFPG